MVKFLGFFLNKWKKKKTNKATTNKFTYKDPEISFSIADMAFIVG